MLLIKLGFSLKQIRAYDYTSTTDDRTTSDIVERYKAEAGLSIRSESLLNLTETLTYRYTLDMFASYDDLATWSIKFENLFDVKVWELIGISIELDLIYNEDQATKSKFK